jgi:hypothetical protein
MKKPALIVLAYPYFVRFGLPASNEMLNDLEKISAFYNNFLFPISDMEF